MTQVFLEAMEGCHLFLSPLFVMQTGIFQGRQPISPGLQRWPPPISSAGVGVPSRLGSPISFHSFRSRRALNRISFPLAGFVGPFDSFPFPLSCEPLFPLLAGFVGPFDSCPFAFLCAESLFALLAGFASQGSACNPFSDDIFSLKTSLSFEYFSKRRTQKSDEVSHHFCAFTQTSRQNCLIPMTSG